MPESILTFAQNPRHGPTVRGRVECVDPVTGHVRLAMTPERGRALVARMDSQQDCMEALRALVCSASDLIFVEADVSLGRVVQMHLVVDNPASLNFAIQEGSLDEESLVVLVQRVWRESKVPIDPLVPEDSEDSYEDLTPSFWKSEQTLFPHQRLTVDWMQRMEKSAPLSLQYAGNVRITNEWYVDVKEECLTQDPAWQYASLRGGVCSDSMGTGKTASMLWMLRHAKNSSQGKDLRNFYTASGTLILLPLNLVSQWQREVRKFLRDEEMHILWLVTAKDVRALDLDSLLSAHLVVTTFHFLRARAYSDVAEAALGGKSRSRASLASWGRQKNHREPLLEAVRWPRIVVDELHQVLDSQRDLRQLRLFSTDFLWGLTATPTESPSLYALLSREEAHHPNLLQRILSVSVRSHAQGTPLLSPSLQLVQLSAEEHLHLRSLTLPEDREARLKAVVRGTSFMDEEHDGEEGYNVEANFRRAKAKSLEALRAKADAHARTVAVLERASVDFDHELQELTEEGCSRQGAADVVRDASEAHMRDLVRAKELLEAARKRVQQRESWDRMVEERIQEVCSRCQVKRCEVLSSCGHLFCRSCIQEDPACGDTQLTSVVAGGGIGTKMAMLGTTVSAIPTRDPVLLFLQWKSMMRPVRMHLRCLGVRVLTLDGNTAQRASTLLEFQSGGTLLLCLEESFAGLHLPHARHVVFAHAIVGDMDRVRELERQAIARSIRPGQVHPPTICSFVVEGSEEEELWRDTHTYAQCT